ncbi:hypothetical protein FNH22_06225 [Fulvivirga sp. M361]|uniref:hypothetical protein n=1 Tax=Fulvivirga sp. M361 TaxID=2594266 RepID=UPI001179F3F8|nr:hypothetical protein [Fulvivirga sp. M361]TRX60638.1 hypothetical protein FNH22_06225 [Fulvivirga sp. M361]
MKGAVFLGMVLMLSSCQKDEAFLQENILADYILLNSSLQLTDLIACAGGKEDGLFGQDDTPTSVFFYPVTGATDFRYFEAENIADSMDFSKYVVKDLTDDPVFNGYLWKFNNTPFTGERMGVVSFKTPGKLHVCTPIRLKTTVKPTELNESLVMVSENGTSPSFSWEDGSIEENVIYFQVISDEKNNLISGTYTFDKEFTFYDLSNVVLNITDTTSVPILKPNANYTFTMMGVSEDNWVNLFIEKEFNTP